jgi:putative methyltransferase (TIGR04325 family)
MRPHSKTPSSGWPSERAMRGPGRGRLHRFGAAKVWGVNKLVRATTRFAKDTYSYLAFTRRGGQFRGVFENFDQAEAAVPSGRRIGYDHEDLAREYQAALSLRLDSFDYPILFHLDRMIAQCRVVFDFGGNIGIHYLRYKRYLKLETVKWTVLDLPAIVRVGRETCFDAPSISFITDIAELNEPQIDVLLASGSMQYLASPDLLLQKLIENGTPPTHILVNRLPLYDGPQFVTLQNGGLVYYPQYVFNRDGFITAIENLDYELIDAWVDAADSCMIPFNPKKSLRTYAGLYFSKTRATLGPTLTATNRASHSA